MRFSIRDLLWLIVVAALIAGWWAERAERIKMAERVAFLERGADLMLHLMREKSGIDSYTVTVDGRPWPK